MPCFSRITRGDPRLPPLIFLHGFLGCKEDWEKSIPFFEDRYHCIAFDLPGHGNTPYCENILDAVKDQILPIGKPILIGYSMGGRIALCLRDCAQSLVAISAHPGLKTEQEKTERRKSDEAWRQKLLTLPIAAFLAEWYAQPIFKGSTHSIPSRRTRQNPKDLAQVLCQMSLANQPYSEYFPCPTLFLHGEYDLKYQQLYSKLPSSVNVSKVDGCSHALHLDNPALCTHSILNWLRGDQC